jgi:hypothetical protein
LKHIPMCHVLKGKLTMRKQSVIIITTLITLLVALSIAHGVQTGHALPQSSNVALVPGPDGEAMNGGHLWEGPFPNGDTFTFTNVDPEQIATNATDPIVDGRFDTVVLVQAYSSWWSDYPLFRSRITSFVGNGGKLIIYDSEMTDQNWTSFIYPFTDSAPGAMGSMNGKLWIVENNGLGSNLTTSYAYVNTTLIGNQTEIGDADVMITFDTDWKTHMVATNMLSVTGPVHTYAVYGNGLIIWNGQDMDPFDYYSFTGIDNINGPNALGMIWYLELKQGVNPISPPLLGQISTAGLSLTPTNAINAIGARHTVTATVTDNLTQPIPNVVVNFSITSGQNAGLTGTGTTDSKGEATFSWTSTTVGVDTVTASANPHGVLLHTQATKTWVTATQLSFEVDFTETGLPSGTQWSVTFNGVNQYSTTSTVSFSNIPPGIYIWTVAASVPSNGGVQYAASPSSGSMNVPSQTTQSIAFTTAQSAWAGYSIELPLLGLVLAIGILGSTAVLVFFLMFDRLRRRRKLKLRSVSR